MASVVAPRALLSPPYLLLFFVYLTDERLRPLVVRAVASVLRVWQGFRVLQVV